MSENDNLQRFIFEKANVRGNILHLNESFNIIMNQHAYPQTINMLLGEALLGATLLTATIKFKGELTIQFHGNEPIHLLVAKCNDELQIRGLAQFDINALSDNLLSAFNNGQLVVTITEEKRTKPWQSIIPIEGQSISKCLEYYFIQSEQLPTQIKLFVNENEACGFFLQMLPDGRIAKERNNFWEHVTALTDTLKPEELFKLNNIDILHRLYHEETLRLFSKQDVNFACPCSIERMKFAIQTMGKQEADTILSEKQVIAVTCEYCNNEYAFSKDEVWEIFNLN